ncbi:MAG: hypothetical protein DYG94_13200 [Leptolyngbya sp. PLA3]|nr:MAG: hypothetical protein EDM82_13515 [Cyanobacteria bacterium CYA]MCE7969682.1 hypothetical protein [Leptolyngbya sp. PL-A3]
MSGEARVLLVGHCGPDAFMLRRAVKAVLRTEHVESVNSAGDLEALVERADLALVNRVLDGDFGTDSGVELIRTRARSGKTRWMLVSNYADAQAAAEAAGALPGFGKAEVNSDKARRRLAGALASVERNVDDPQSDQGRGVS